MLRRILERILEADCNKPPHEVVIDKEVAEKGYTYVDTKEKVKEGDKAWVFVREVDAPKNFEPFFFKNKDEAEWLWKKFREGA